MLPVTVQVVNKIIIKNEKSSDIFLCETSIEQGVIASLFSTKKLSNGVIRLVTQEVRILAKKARILARIFTIFDNT